MNILCKMGLHRYRKVATFENGILVYRKCKYCGKRDYILTRNPEGRIIVVDYDYIKGDSYVPRTKMELEEIRLKGENND